MLVNNLLCSRNGLALMQQFEGLCLTAYQDCVGVWTIGYGHTGRDVHAGLNITEEQALDLLMRDSAAAAAAVNRLVTAKLTQNQFDALVSFVYNLGQGSLASSTLLRMLNAGDHAGAADQFPRWNKAGGVVVAGLQRRREAERALFMAPDATAQTV